MHTDIVTHPCLFFLFFLQLRALHNLREQARAMSAMLQGPGGLDADAREAAGLVDEAQTLRLAFRVSRRNADAAGFESVVHPRTMC